MSKASKKDDKVLGVAQKKTAPKQVKGKVKAVAMGYYKGAIVREGAEFNYEGLGKFPLWVEVLKDESPKAGKAEKTEEESADSIV